MCGGIAWQAYQGVRLDGLSEEAECGCAACLQQSGGSAAAVKWEVMGEIAIVLLDSHPRSTATHAPSIVAYTDESRRDGLSQRYTRIGRHAKTRLLDGDLSSMTSS